MSSQLPAINKSSEVSLIDNVQQKIELWKNTFAKGLTNEEFEIFKYACIRTGLDPIFKQIHAVKRKDRTLGREVMTIQTGIDGYRLIAERTTKYSPGREYTYQYNEKGELVSSTAYIKKMTPDGTWHEVSSTAFYTEYVQTKYDGTPTQFWSKMKHNQLGKCAEALALRKAFPADLSGIYTTEEMGQADLQVADNVEVICEKKQESVPKKHIEDLMNLILECSPQYQTKVTNFLKNNNMETLYELRHETYVKLNDAATRAKNEFSEHLKKEQDLQLTKAEELEVVSESA